MSAKPSKTLKRNAAKKCSPARHEFRGGLFYVTGTVIANREPLPEVVARAPHSAQISPRCTATRKHLKKSH
ncbi:hypothetical protein [Cupriavidus taiwanensis]|uniref:Uncharacterized protein n=1 Tax=Cupriavidus taiwanensis TaxID=164546 RepID=A0A7Z7NNS3_9BURK|nr:hypothetical protein [Cupriavidus taiwanensis]SOZ09791.1 hypothetical protein CBM2597_B30366 [Cupriavidus taiwanensis]SOZ11910.1 hypothetical protein CBM2595_B40362 [Cupriavidus taiwanensis]SOZ43265.1 hypothetical protein CBM2598_B30362 [Cupriavidus taiwanensis]SPC22511.1 hypothetical protein CBM2594_B30361 [Cupriavidus taiwanensis]SPD54021.1 conserved protein of unknown function [Cupriavidus taiwanensis]